MDFGLCIRISDNPSTWIYQNLDNPIRQPGDDFQTIRGESGHAIVRGSNQGVMNDPRIYGNYISWSTYFKLEKFQTLITNFQLLFLDKSEDALCYEALGPWCEMVTDPNGANLFRTWNFRAGGREIYQRYPKNWEQYFSRVEIYPKTPLGKLAYFIFFTYSKL